MAVFTGNTKNMKGFARHFELMYYHQFMASDSIFSKETEDRFVYCCPMEVSFIGNHGNTCISHNFDIHEIKKPDFCNGGNGFKLENLGKTIAFCDGNSRIIIHEQDDDISTIDMFEICYTKEMYQKAKDLYDRRMW